MRDFCFIKLFKFNSTEAEGFIKHDIIIQFFEMANQHIKLVMVEILSKQNFNCRHNAEKLASKHYHHAADFKLLEFSSVLKISCTVKICTPSSESFE